MLHGYTCTYCTSTGGDPINRPTWQTRAAYEHHHEQTHHGLPFEPPMADWATHKHVEKTTGLAYIAVCTYVDMAPDTDTLIIGERLAPNLSTVQRQIKKSIKQSKDYFTISDYDVYKCIRLGRGDQILK